MDFIRARPSKSAMTIQGAVVLPGHEALVEQGRDVALQGGGDAAKAFAVEGRNEKNGSAQEQAT